MKKILLIIFILTSSFLYSQITQQWINPFGTPNVLGMDPQKVLADDSNNVYIMHEALILNETSVSPSRQPYLQKINKYGQTAWFRNFGTSGLHKEPPLDFVIGKDKFIYYLCRQGEAGAYVKLFKISLNNQIIWEKDLGYYSYSTNYKVKFYSHNEAGQIYNNTIYVNQRLSLEKDGVLCLRSEDGLIINTVYNIVNQDTNHINTFDINNFNSPVVMTISNTTGNKNYLQFTLVSNGQIFWTTPINAKSDSCSLLIDGVDCWLNIGSSIYNYSLNGNSLWHQNVQVTGTNIKFIPRHDVASSSTGITKYDYNGNILWHIPITSFDSRYDISRGYDEYLYVCASSQILKIDPSSGMIVRTTNVSPDYHLYNIIGFPTQAPGYEIVVSGEVNDNENWGTAATIKYSQPVGISTNSTQITSYSLSQNYPNPFNPTTKINYELKNAGFVSLKIYDLLGREVAELVNMNQDAGRYSMDFNASKYMMASGIYFYRIKAGEFIDTKRMVLVK